MKRIKTLEESEIIDFKDMIGLKVSIVSQTMQNGIAWSPTKYSYEKDEYGPFRISNIQFRVSLDGKCFSIVSLDGIFDRRFTLKDIKVYGD